MTLTPVSTAFSTWSKYAGYVESTVHLTHEGHAYLARLPAILNALNSSQVEVERAQFQAEHAQREIDDGFWMLHSHSLLGMWGALETLVGDIFIARMAEDPGLLNQEALRSLKLPVSTFADNDLEKVAAATLDAIWASGGPRSAPERFERVLKLVNLGGKVPAKISSALNSAHKIRNLCAHRGGVIDSRYLSEVGNSGLEIGQRVALTASEFLFLMHAAHMYAIIIFNRLQFQRGEELKHVECVGFSGTLSEVFPSIK